MTNAEDAAERIVTLLGTHPLGVVREALGNPDVARAIGGVPDGWAYRAVVRLHTFHLTPADRVRPRAEVALLPPPGEWEAHLVAAVLPDFCDHVRLVQHTDWRVR